MFSATSHPGFSTDCAVLRLGVSALWYATLVMAITGFGHWSESYPHAEWDNGPSLSQEGIGLRYGPKRIAAEFGDFLNVGKCMNSTCSFLQVQIL